MGPLLPAQESPNGRTRRDHRGGRRDLWVPGTGSSWRNLPGEEFGFWQTVYGSYQGGTGEVSGSAYRRRSGAGNAEASL